MPVQILAHRGYWKEKSKQNTLGSFRSALDQGVGLETDFRDYNGQLVISHDMPTADASLASHVFTALQDHPNFQKVVYALNIKSDGIQTLVKQFIDQFGLHENSFVFDMSGPSHFSFTKVLPAKNIGTRISDIENPPLFLKESKWIWVDQFEEFIFTADELKAFQSRDKILVFVSPELHKRDHNDLWDFIEANFECKGKLDPSPIYLCTDLVDEAKKRFNTSDNNPIECD